MNINLTALEARCLITAIGESEINMEGDGEFLGGYVRGHAAAMYRCRQKLNQALAENGECRPPRRAGGKPCSDMNP